MWGGGRGAEQEGMGFGEQGTAPIPGSCSKPSLPQNHFRKPKAGSILRCKVSLPGQMSSFQQVEATLLFHRPSLPSSGFRGIVREDKHRQPLFLLYLHPRRQVGSRSLVLAAKVKQSKLLWQGNATFWGGTQVEPIPEDLRSRDKGCSASAEGRGSMAPPHHSDLSFQRDL